MHVRVHAALSRASPRTRVQPRAVRMGRIVMRSRARWKKAHDAERLVAIAAGELVALALEVKLAWSRLAT